MLPSRGQWQGQGQEAAPDTTLTGIRTKTQRSSAQQGAAVTSCKMLVDVCAWFMH